MTTTPNATPGLLGRRSECDRLSGALAAAKAGRSQVLVIRGEAGIGKTALLHFLADRSTGCRVARASGVESEMELPYAGLQQLCRPYLDRLMALPRPQQEALCAAFGLRTGSAPDRFVVGLAALSLFTEVAEDRPLVCVIDDAQWLDQASSQALDFVARRLVAEPVVLVLATRGSTNVSFAGLPELRLRGLGARDAAALLDTTLNSSLDRRVRDRILAECQGNPLALLELPRDLSTAELAFGSGTGSSPAPLVHRLEQGFLRQIEALPAPTRQLLLTAAADPVGDVPLLLRAAERLGIGNAVSAAAGAAGLFEIRERARFRHPLVRSAAYRAGTHAELRRVHRALADAIDPDLDPDRRAWHRAQATVGADETVAAELERSAGRALTRGGFAAAAAFLERAAGVTPDPAQRVRRSLDAAEAKVAAGAFDDASHLLAIAGMGPLGGAQQARIEVLQAQMRFARDRGAEALPLLLGAARRLEPLDPARARETYLDAISAAIFAGRLATGPGIRDVATIVRQAAPPPTPRKADLLLESLSVVFTDGYCPAAPLSHRAVQAFVHEDLSRHEDLRFTWLAASTAASLWDDAAWDVLTRRHLETAREAGSLSALPLALTSRIYVLLFSGDLAAAESLAQQVRSTEEVTGVQISLARYAEISLAAVRGDAERAEPWIAECLADVTARGEGVGVTMMQWARAVLLNGLGRYAEALDAAGVAGADPSEPGPLNWSLAEVVEAAVRSGHTGSATAALERLSAMAVASGTDWALGTAASRRALLSEGTAAEDLHLEAIARLGRTVVRVDLARARLLYGEWLRREGRRVDARAQLRIAHQQLAEMGVEAFAERARRELLATGETVRKRNLDSPAALTAQEAHIAGLAAQGLTNPEIGATLYISPRTVEWHLRKIFTKLGVTTRRELRRSSREDTGNAAAARYPSPGVVPAPRSGATESLERRSDPWKSDHSPAAQASRRPGAARSRSGRISAVAARRSSESSWTDVRPQNQ